MADEGKRDRVPDTDVEWSRTEPGGSHHPGRTLAPRDAGASQDLGDGKCVEAPLSSKGGHGDRMGCRCVNSNYRHRRTATISAPGEKRTFRCLDTLESVWKINPIPHPI